MSCKPGLGHCNTNYRTIPIIGLLWGILGVAEQTGLIVRWQIMKKRNAILTATSSKVHAVGSLSSVNALSKVFESVNKDH